MCQRRRSALVRPRCVTCARAANHQRTAKPCLRQHNTPVVSRPYAYLAEALAGVPASGVRQVHGGLLGHLRALIRRGGRRVWVSRKVVLAGAALRPHGAQVAVDQQRWSKGSSGPGDRRDAVHATHRDVVLERDVADLNVIVRPLAKELDFAGGLGHGARRRGLAGDDFASGARS